MSDLEERLRKWAKGADEQGLLGIAQGMLQSAGEIERLAAKVLEQQREIQRLLDEQTGHRVAISQLTAERDEARREVSKWECRYRRMSEEDYAASRGWRGCFPPRKMFEGIKP